MASSSLDGLYYDFHIPLGLKTLVEQLVANQPNARNVTGTIAGSATNREWFSQPRVCTDTTTEVITTRFKLPLSVNEIAFDLLRVPCKAEVWYLDRLNNWRQALDGNRVPIIVPVQSSAAAAWYSFSTAIYPIVAQAMQIRITRTVDPAVGTNPYVVGLKNTLIRRNVYDRSQGKLPFGDEQDALGNVISKYVEDWDASQAIDNKPFTFWKSAPMPDPEAVVSLFLDTRTPDGKAQYMDALFLDPVYTGQKLNIYYSNDDTDAATSTRLSPITLRPDDGNDSNTDWKAGRGRWDTSPSPAGFSHYRVAANWGPLANQAAWIGLEWIPDFDATTSLPENPVLFEAIPSTWTTDQFAPSIYFDSGAGAVVLKFYDGSVTKTYSATLSPGVVKGQALRIAVGWSYGPDTVHLRVQDRAGTVLATLDQPVPHTNPTYPALPGNVTFDGTVGFSNFRGTFTTHIIKRESFDSAALFLNNPLIYVDPDPVIPDTNGVMPSTTLDNALYAVDWTLQPHGTGGAHESFFTGKVWTPIYRDFITRRGKMFFPQSIAAKYLKLEFTRLTEESYPVYDAGIQVNYQVFPVSVNQTQTVNHPGLLGTVSGLLTVGAQTLVGTLTNINWLNPTTVATAINSVFGPISNPVTITTGPGYVTGSLPGTADAPLADTARDEMASPYLYRRSALNPNALAANEVYYSGFTTWSQTLNNAVGLVEGSIADSFTPLKDYVTSIASGPVQGNDWWVFPGGTLKMPAAIMNGLTALTQTVLGRPATTETRLRFNTQSVHRYETKTVTRDAAVAYFAGIREVQPLLTTYINQVDSVVYQFDNYTEHQNWILENTRLIAQETKTFDDGAKLPVGPITTAGSIYSIENSDFDRGLGTDQPGATWTIKSGSWTWDGSTFNGRSYPGTALATGNSEHAELWSSPIRDYPNEVPQVGAAVKINTYVKWKDLEVTNGQPGIQLGLVTYNADGLVIDDTIVLDQVSYSNWGTHKNNAYKLLSGTWTVPSGVAEVRVRLVVTEHASAGNVWFDSLTLESGEPVTASVSQGFDTQSDFAKLRCDFTDSGVVRSDSMWARLPIYSSWTEYDKADSPDNYPGGKDGKTPDTAPAKNKDGSDYVFPFASQQAYVMSKMKEILAAGGEATTEHYRLNTSQWTSVDDTRLAYYTEFISLDLINDGTRRPGGGTWNDPLVQWSDANVAWGSLDSLVTITVLPDHIFQGQRVLHFTRRSGAGSCGVKVRQWTNFVPNAMFRLCARWYKPNKNGNNITLRLRRCSDGAVIRQEIIDKPAQGYWYEHAGNFQAIPSGDQNYYVELETSGDSEDELYLSDLWVEISHVRYFMQLGDNPIQDVTDLRYADTAVVSCTRPVNHFYVEARVYSPRATITGCKIQPMYLK